MLKLNQASCSEGCFWLIAIYGFERDLKKVTRYTLLFIEDRI